MTDNEVWLSDEPMHNEDPRWAYPELTKAQTSTAWPCATCGTRRDEHADQSTDQSAFPALDITDHDFAFSATLTAESGRYLGFVGREPEGDFQMIAGHPTDPRWVSDNLRDWVETHPLEPWQAALVVQLVEVVAENIPEGG